QILTERRLLGHARLARIEEARGSVAAQVGDQHAIPGGGERRDHAVPGPRVVREAVEQDDGRAARAAVRLVGDLQRPRSHREDLGHRARSYVIGRDLTTRHGGRRLSGGTTTIRGGERHGWTARRQDRADHGRGQRNRAGVRPAVRPGGGQRLRGRSRSGGGHGDRAAGRGGGAQGAGPASRHHRRGRQRRDGPALRGGARGGRRARGRGGRGGR